MINKHARAGSSPRARGRRELDLGVARADAELACAATAEDVAQADRVALRARACRAAAVVLDSLARTDDLRSAIRLEIQIRRWFENHGPRLGGAALDELAQVLDSERGFLRRGR